MCKTKNCDEMYSNEFFEFFTWNMEDFSSISRMSIMSADTLITIFDEFP